MHRYHKQAERLTKEVIKKLEKFLPNDEVNISYFHPGAIDDLIMILIRIKVLLACANEAEGRNG